MQEEVEGIGDYENKEDRYNNNIYSDYFIPTF